MLQLSNVEYARSETGIALLLKTPTTVKTGIYQIFEGY